MICFVYRPKKSRIWRGRYRFAGKLKYTEVSLETADKQSAKKRLDEIVQELEREAAGIIAPKIQRESALQSLTKHLQDFITDLESTGHADTYTSLLDYRIRRLIKECEWTLPRDVTVNSFQLWRQHQVNPAKTLNDYLEAASCLLNWMIENGRIIANPLASVKRVDTSGQKTRIRRAFTSDEILRLLAVSKVRAVIYLMALRTGLRRKELMHLDKSDPKLDAPLPFVEVKSWQTKNGKPAKIPLRPDVVRALREMLQERGQDDNNLLFVKFPRIERFKRDLKSAGIAYIDADGRVADFHSLRKTFCTDLANAGIARRVHMELMRHSDSRLTDEIYTDEALLETGLAISKLPDYSMSVPNPVTQLVTQTPVTTSQFGSSGDTQQVLCDAKKTPVNIGENHDLALITAECNWRERRGSNPQPLP